MADTVDVSADKVQRSRGWAVPFFAIWTGQVFSLVGSRVLEFALVWWLTELTGSATILATSTLTMVLPQVILGPILGAYVDRWNRRLVMMLADSFVALFAAWLAYLFWTGDIQIWHVYVAMGMRSIGGCFHWPAMQASTAMMVPDRHLSRVAGLNQTMNGALNIVGPSLGALLLMVLPFHDIMLMDVLTALIAVSPLFFVSVPQPEGARDVRQSILTDVKAGLRYVWRWPGLLAVILMAMTLNFIMNPAFSLMPLLITDHFGGGALQLGWMESSWGAGLVLGGLLLSLWGGFKRRVYTSLIGLIIEGLGVTAVGLAPASGLWLALGGMFVAGMMNAFVNGPFFAVLQANVAREMQGRVFTLVGSVSAAAWPLSLMVAGPIADAVGVRPWYAVGGLICAAIGLGACFVPVIVGLEDNRSGDSAADARPEGAACGETRAGGGGL
ncbi:MAG: MFS transporter [Chloroflexi bacterium]|nr:MFS transporter [Chloroflexota bacterium]